MHGGRELLLIKHVLLPEGSWRARATPRAASSGERRAQPVGLNTLHKPLCTNIYPELNLEHLNRSPACRRSTPLPFTPAETQEHAPQTSTTHLNSTRQWYACETPSQSTSQTRHVLFKCLVSVLAQSGVTVLLQTE